MHGARAGRHHAQRRPRLGDDRCARRRLRGAHAEPLICAVSGRRDFPPSDEEPMQTAVAGALGMRHIAPRESEWLLGRPIVDLSLELAQELPGPSRIYWLGGYIGFYRHVAAHGVHGADRVGWRQLGECR